MKGLITDLDNTLYDWVTYFATAFDAMLQELQPLLGVPRAQLISEFKAIHQRAGSSENPYSVLELPSVADRFGHARPDELLLELRRPLAAFNAARAETLKLYQGVEPGLRAIRDAGFAIVGHTEAAAINAYHRLSLLGTASLFDRLYVRDASAEHLDPARRAQMTEAKDKIRVLRKGERKPDPRLLFDICGCEHLDIDQVWYVGDSLTRDIAMANAAGIPAIWAKYGTEYDPKHWQMLVSITHWTDEDVAREAVLREALPSIHPDFTVSSFADIPAIVGVRTEVPLR